MILLLVYLTPGRNSQDISVAKVKTAILPDIRDTLQSNCYWPTVPVTAQIPASIIKDDYLYPGWVFLHIFSFISRCVVMETSVTLNSLSWLLCLYRSGFEFSTKHTVQLTILVRRNSPVGGGGFSCDLVWQWNVLKNWLLKINPIQTNLRSIITIKFRNAQPRFLRSLCRLCNNFRHNTCTINNWWTY